MLSGGSNIRSVALIKMMVKNVEMNIQQSSARQPQQQKLMTFSFQLRAVKQGRLSAEAVILEKLL